MKHEKAKALSKLAFSATVALLASLLPAFSTALAVDMTTPPTKAGDHVPGQLLVSFKDGTLVKTRHDIFKKLGLVEKSKVGSTELYLVETSENASLDSLIETLKALPEVRFAEKNVTMKIFKPVKDPVPVY